MIEVRDVYKRFGSTQALAGVSFEARPGEICGLLGPNGAGKTTLIHVLAGIEVADQGQALVGGIDVRQKPKLVQTRVGLVPQEPGLYGSLTARENLSFWGTMYGVPSRQMARRIDELLHLTGLTERAKEPVSRFSGGMRRRLNLALGLVHHPPVILLDEPTLEVDPQSRRQIVDFVRHLAREGATVVYTTHQLADAQEVCDRLAILDRGRVVASGTLPELRRFLPAAGALRIEFAQELQGEIQERLGALPGAGQVAIAGGVATVEVADLRQLLPACANLLSMPGVTGLRVEEASLEAVFLHLTGRGPRD